MQDRCYPPYSVKNLVIWRGEVAVMRVAGKMECVTMPRDEAFDLLAPHWDAFVHKGVVEDEGRWDERPTPPPSANPEGTRQRKEKRARGGGSSSDASVTDRTVSSGACDIAAPSRPSQRVSWMWLVDSGF